MCSYSINNSTINPSFLVLFSRIYYVSTFTTIELGWKTTHFAWSSHKQKINVRCSAVADKIFESKITRMHPLVHLTSWKHGNIFCARNNVYSLHPICMNLYKEGQRELDFMLKISLSNGSNSSHSSHSDHTHSKEKLKRVMTKVGFLIA